MTLGMVVITPEVIRYDKNPLVMDVRLPAQNKITGDPGGTEDPDQPDHYRNCFQPQWNLHKWALKRVIWSAVLDFYQT